MGLGRQMAEGLAEMGANLVLCARKKDRCEEVAEALRSRGVQALALGCDVKDKAAIQQVVDAGRSNSSAGSTFWSITPACRGELQWKK